MKIIYNSKEIDNFNLDRYYNSLNRYGKVTKEQIEDELKELHYDPMHYSVLVELGVKLLPDDKSAKKYYNDHQTSEGNFERLRRITGYLVGSLERWNDGKQAEERDRVKHVVCVNCDGVYSAENKDRLEAEKAATVTDRQDEYQKGI